MRHAPAAALLLAVALSPAAIARQPGDAFATADAAIRAEMEKAGIPGAAVAVVVGDKVVWSRGFGLANVETSAPVTADTLFQIGSVTKSFTAAALLTAASQGAIALDKPVSTYVSGLTACVGAPTLTQLLSHTAGIIDEPDEFGPQGEEGLGAYQRTWTSEYCLLPPGRAFSYSNSGFSLAGLALQEVDKKPYADVMRARVLAPLGMTRTTFRPMEAMTWPLALGHRKSKEGEFEVVRPLPNDARLWPAGTLYSSANEMARFVIALMNDGKVDGNQALPVGVAGRMRTAVVSIPTTGEHYGLGAFLQARGAGHGGTMTGYAAQMALINPDGRTPAIGVIVLTNGDGVNPSGIEKAATAAARAAVSPSNAETITLSDKSPLPTRQLTEAQAAAFVGTYRNPRRFTVEVVRAGSSLTLKRFGRDFPMRALETSGVFLVDLPRGGTEAIAFGSGSNGRADYLQMNVWALARVPVAK